MNKNVLTAALLAGGLVVAPAVSEPLVKQKTTATVESYSGAAFEEEGVHISHEQEADLDGFLRGFGASILSAAYGDDVDSYGGAAWLNTKVGEISIGAMHTQVDFRGESSDRVVASVGYGGRKVSAFAGGITQDESPLTEASGAFGKVDYQITPKFKASATYLDNAAWADAFAPQDLVTFLPRTYMADTLLPSATDAPRLQWDVPMNATEFGAEWEGKKNSLGANVRSGEQRFLGVGPWSPFHGFDVRYGFDGNKTDFNAELQANSLDAGVTASRFTTDFSRKGGRTKIDFNAFVNSEAPGLDLDVNFKDEWGAAGKFETRIGKLWTGLFAGIEGDESQNLERVYLGAPISFNDYELLAGVSTAEQGRERFLKESSGGFIGAKIPIGKVELQLFAGSDVESYGSFNLKWTG